MKMKFAVLIGLLFFALLAGIAYANGPVGKTIQSDKIVDLDSGNGALNPDSIKQVVLRNKSLGSDFLMQFDFQDCLKQCDSKYNSCISKAGNNPSAKFRCGEDRFACTRSCDNQYYSQMKF